MSNTVSFSESRFLQNIQRALAFTEMNKVSKLIQEGHVRYSNTGSPSLFYRSIDEYVMASGVSLRSLMFDSEDIPSSYYSNIDAHVINALNMLSDDQLINLKSSIRHFYYNPLMDTSYDLTPSARFNAILRSRRNSGLPSEIPPEEMYKYRKNVSMEINRYKRSKYSLLFTFHPDYWMDLSTVVGVSVRWILGIDEVPLFCNRGIADDIFDLYTLMSPVKKYSFIALLLRISPVALSELEEFFLEGGRIV